MLWNVRQLNLHISCRPRPAAQSRTASGSIAFSAPYGSGALPSGAPLHYPYTNGVQEEGGYGLLPQGSHPLLGVPPQAYRAQSSGLQVRLAKSTQVLSESWRLVAMACCHRGHTCCWKCLCRHTGRSQVACK